MHAAHRISPSWGPLPGIVMSHSEFNNDAACKPWGAGWAVASQAAGWPLSCSIQIRLPFALRVTNATVRRTIQGATIVAC